MKIEESTVDPYRVLLNLSQQYISAFRFQSEAWLDLELFMEFADELTEYRNSQYPSDLHKSKIALATELVEIEESAEMQLDLLRFIMRGSGCDITDLPEVFGKTVTNAYDMKPYEVFQCIFIDRSDYNSFIRSIYHFIFD